MSSARSLGETVSASRAKIFRGSPRPPAGRRFRGRLRFFPSGRRYLPPGRPRRRRYGEGTAGPCRFQPAAVSRNMPVSLKSRRTAVSSARSRPGSAPPRESGRAVDPVSPRPGGTAVRTSRQRSSISTGPSRDDGRKARSGSNFAAPRLRRIRRSRGAAKFDPDLAFRPHSRRPGRNRISLREVRKRLSRLAEETGWTAGPRCPRKIPIPGSRSKAGRRPSARFERNRHVSQNGPPGSRRVASVRSSSVRRRALEDRGYRRPYGGKAKAASESPCSRPVEDSRRKIFRLAEAVSPKDLAELKLPLSRASYLGNGGPSSRQNPGTAR